METVFEKRKFEAETDHQALVGYINIYDPHGKVARWTAELLNFRLI